MVFRRDISFDLLESWILRCVRVQPTFQDKVSQIHVAEGGIVPSYMLQIITYFNIGIDRQAFAPEAVSIDVGIGHDLPPGQDFQLIAQDIDFLMRPGPDAVVFRKDKPFFRGRPFTDLHGILHNDDNQLVTPSFLSLYLILLIVFTECDHSTKTAK